MRRKDRQISESESYEILERGEYGVLSLIDQDGYPYSIPLNYYCKDKAIYLHSAVEGKKIDIIKQNPSASFCVVGETEVLPQKFGTLYESVIIRGSVSEAVDDEKQMALEGLIYKYSSEFAESGMKYIIDAFMAVRVFRISIDSISGKANKG